MAFHTSIVASDRNGTLYTGSIDSIYVRSSQHRQKLLGGFTAKYGVDRLVWYEPHETRHAAFVRERQIKKWNRVWKLELIEKANPEWLDLIEEIF